MNNEATAIATTQSSAHHVDSVEALAAALVSIEVDSAFGIVRHASEADVAALDAVAFECDINAALASVFTADRGEWKLDADSIAFLDA